MYRLSAMNFGFGFLNFIQESLLNIWRDLLHSLFLQKYRYEGGDDIYLTLPGFK